MEEAVAPLAGAYDLDKDRATIQTALAAGRAEVRLNHARKTASLKATEFDAEIVRRFGAAETAADIDELLVSAREYAATAGDELDKKLNVILDEAR